MKRSRRPATRSETSDSAASDGSGNAFPTNSTTSSPSPAAPPGGKKEPIIPLRIIGGQLKGSKLKYSGDPRTRPMKDRVREAVFNLVGPPIKGMQAIDLFAGTGALAIESISRGGTSAIAFERHFPTADLIKENGRMLEVDDRLQVLAGDTFIWVKRLLGGQAAAIPLPELSTGPWAVYCCPPYALYEERLDDLLEMIARFYEYAPSGSCIVVEADERFDFDSLLEPESWDVRKYWPAFVGILRKE